MGFLKKICVLSILILVLNCLVVDHTFASPPIDDVKAEDSEHTPQSRLSPEIDIPLTKDTDNRGWTKKNKWAFVGMILLIGGAALLSAGAVNSDDGDSIPHTNTGGVKGSW